MHQKFFSKAALFFAFILLGSITVNAQENDSLLQQRIRQQEYVFVPQTFSSPSFNTSIMSPEYRMRVKPDSIIVSLPYFGKSNTPQFGKSDDDDIRFASTDFEYSAVAKKKGKWEITIKPKDARGVRLFLTVFDNGDAQMDVTSPRKETMLFKGYVW